MGLTVTTMAQEIVAGMLYGSMALLADGWHMGTHAAALGITAMAYYFARTYARDQRFTFGTGKVGVLGGFTSAVVSAVVALLMAFKIENIYRLIESDADNRIADLHLWKISANQLAAIISVVTHFPQPPEYYKRLLAPVHDLAHLTVEVIHCDTEPCLPLEQRS